MKIVCVGDNCIDYYIQSQQAHFGGNPVNVAVYASRNQINAAYIGYMGNDDLSDQFYNELVHRHIDVSHVNRLEGQCAITEVEIVNNERYLGDYDEGVFKDFKLTEDDLSYINQFDLMVTGIWSRTDSYLHHINIPIAYDFADKWDSDVFHTHMQYLTFAFYSDDVHDLNDIKAFMQSHYHPHLKVFICTRGIHGSIAYDGHQFYEYGITPCSVVDTMGAGDSYITAFLISYFNHQDVNKAMKCGADESAITLSYQGAW